MLFAGGLAPALLPITPAAAQSDSSFLDRMKNMFSPKSSSSSPQSPKSSGEPESDLGCPTVDVRNGASTITIHGAGEAGSTNVKYQATIAQTARECAVLGATMTVKVGMEGRLLLGPAGGPGQIDIPVRVALVHEGPEPKTLWTRLATIPVAVAAGQTKVSFVHVEQDVTFPTPKPEDIEMYVVYVGFDPQGAKEPKGKPAAKPKAKPQAAGRPQQLQPPQRLQQPQSQPQSQPQPLQRRESGAAPPAR